MMELIECRNRVGECCKLRMILKMFLQKSLLQKKTMPLSLFLLRLDIVGNLQAADSRSIMKRFLLLGLFLCGMNLIVFPLSRDYYLKQAESYQREARFYFNQAEGYERDARYYNNQAQKYLKDAEYYAGKNDLDKVATYQRWAKDALDKARTRTRWADEARNKGKTRLEWAREALRKASNEN